MPITARQGPSPFLSNEEENAIAEYLSEMAMRGMGLRPADVMKLVQNFVIREKRKTPFKNNRPGYTWYYGFISRHAQKIQMRKETLLETSRSKVTHESMDKWFTDYRAFLSKRDLLDKGHRIWNIDETGFTMGSKPGKVIGPVKSVAPVDCPNVSGGSSKERSIVLYSANAEGSMMPPFFVYPEPKPRSYNPMIGAQRGSTVVYTKKGWMNSDALCAFYDNFDKYSGQERPVVLLMDSVSSHLNMDIFSKAISLQIEIYSLVPNATHLIQPLD